MDVDAGSSLAVVRADEDEPAGLKTRFSLGRRRADASGLAVLKVDRPDAAAPTLVLPNMAPDTDRERVRGRASSSALGEVAVAVATLATLGDPGPEPDKLALGAKDFRAARADEGDRAGSSREPSTRADCRPASLMMPVRRWTSALDELSWVVISPMRLVIDA